MVVDNHNTTKRDKISNKRTCGVSGTDEVVDAKNIKKKKNSNTIRQKKNQHTFWW
jgi:hypothetical protein